jgi:hypothetical protein
MSTSAICLDQNQNSVSCSDPSCTYGDCGSTSTQVTSGSLCLDQDQNAVACSDPNCTYGDCTPSAVGAIGLASASGSDNGITTLSAPHTGGAVAGTGSTSTLSQVLSAVSSGANAATSIVTAPPKTSLTLGSSGLSISSAGSLFSNPLMLLLLAVITVLLFGLFRKKSS